MLAKLQRDAAIRNAVNEAVKNGRDTNISKIIASIKDVFGRPLTTVRKAMYGRPIGGRDGRDIERTFTEVKSDLDRLYEAAISISNVSVKDYVAMNAAISAIRAELSLTKDRLNAIVAQANLSAEKSIAGDICKDADSLLTTCFIDYSTKQATLPITKYASIPVEGEIKEVYPGKTLHNSFSNALDGLDNTGWFAYLEGPYTCTISNINKTVNGIYIKPASTITITAEYTNDGYNYYELFTKTISEEISIINEDTYVKNLKLTIAAGHAAITNLSFIAAGYDEIGEYITEEYIPGIPIVSLTLIPECVIPAKTNLSFYIKPYFDTGEGDYQTITSSISFADTISYTTKLTDNIKSEDEWLYRYDVNIHPYKQPRLDVGVGSIYPELGQLWAEVIHPNKRTAELTDSGIDELIRYESPHTEGPITLPTTDGTISDSTIDPPASMLNLGAAVESSAIKDERYWLVFPFSTGEDNNVYYRYKINVITDEDIPVVNAPAIFLNPSIYNGTDSPILTARIFLNGNLIADIDKTLTCNIDDPTINSYGVSYLYKKGNNLFEVLVHLNNTEGLAMYGAGIYIGGNPYLLARKGKASIRPYLDPMTCVDEFTMRNIIKPMDRTKFGLTDGYDQDILLNFDPGSFIEQEFDGFGGHSYSPLNISLEHIERAGAMPTGFKLKARFEKEPDVNISPILKGYTIGINK